MAIVLGIETSCDDTGVGIVDTARHIHANVISSQLIDHQPYGGVVPEIAARAHLDVLDAVISQALRRSGLGFNDLSAIAATAGPGLIGGVMVGVMMGKAIAAVGNLPFIAVNHLEAHALTARLTDNIEFPYLLLLASGGHCQLLFVRGVGDYRLLGQTIDDAVGECFDKCAKLLGLGYPGGPLIEKVAINGNPAAFSLPRPMMGRTNCDFSFSGLKTAVRTLITGKNLTTDFVADVAASLQAAIGDCIADRTQNALGLLYREGIKPTALVTAGGVAANQALRLRLKIIADHNRLSFTAPPPLLCTDNGVMVAWAGLELLRLGFIDGLDAPARPRWRLQEA